MKKRNSVLIVDDAEVNRAILNEMFKNQYNVIEAENGVEAIERIKENEEDIAIILLDIMMPVLDGFGVLRFLKDIQLINTVPVIMITSDDTRESEEQAYNMGVSDIIYKPFTPHIVLRRASNTIDLYQYKNNLEYRLEQQSIKLKQQALRLKQNNDFLIEALSSVVEFRSKESGEHVRRIKTFTKVLLQYMQRYYPGYGLTDDEIDMIIRASSMHDIGKIGIPDAILLKPARLTKYEFEVMKTHTTIGCDILDTFTNFKGDPFYSYCYEICRSHHERWDGGGYPEGLSGDEIPLSAQVVALADVYDALVSNRVYKAAFPHSEAVKMIMEGDCGVFAPAVLDCFGLALEEFKNICDKAEYIA